MSNLEIANCVDKLAYKKITALTLREGRLSIKLSSGERLVIKGEHDPTIQWQTVDEPSKLKGGKLINVKVELDCDDYEDDDEYWWNVYKVAVFTSKGSLFYDVKVDDGYELQTHYLRKGERLCR